MFIYLKVITVSHWNKISDGAHTHTHTHIYIYIYIYIYKRGLWFLLAHLMS